MATFNISFTESDNFKVSFSDSDALSVSFGEVIEVDRDTEIYDGDYEFTPTLEEQTIMIADKTATADIIINPIPSNYGLITWNGSTITVS